MPKKLTIYDFIQRSNKIHKNFYDYSLVNYTNNRTKVKIICPKHGEFEQVPDSHMKGIGCYICKGGKKLTTDEFIIKANEKHNKRYDYSLVDYKNAHSKIKIICKEHGEFDQKPKNHLLGKGCPSCSKTNKLTNEEFIEKVNIIHNNIYDYSLVDYKNIKTKVKIICQKHGIFEQSPNSHLRGNGCPKCSKNYKKTKEVFINDSNKRHNNFYDYSIIDYKNMKSKIDILCPTHNIFSQLPSEHIKGSGCPKCANKNITTEEYIERVEKIHNFKYNYSSTKYINSSIKIDIICQKHGLFKQKTSDHLNGSGCPKCSSSKGEKEILKHLKENKISFESEKTFNNCKHKNKLSFDFYLPIQNTAIEYDGLQHFQPVEYFGGEKRFNEDQKRDKMKNKYCKENNITLIRIPYWKKNDIYNILKNNNII